MRGRNLAGEVHGHVLVLHKEGHDLADGPLYLVVQRRKLVPRDVPGGVPLLGLGPLVQLGHVVGPAVDLLRYGKAEVGDVGLGHGPARRQAVPRRRFVQYLTVLPQQGLVQAKAHAVIQGDLDPPVRLTPLGYVG